MKQQQQQQQAAFSGMMGRSDVSAMRSLNLNLKHESGNADDDAENDAPAAGTPPPPSLSPAGTALPSCCRYVLALLLLVRLRYPCFWYAFDGLLPVHVQPPRLFRPSCQHSVQSTLSGLSSDFRPELTCYSQAVFLCARIPGSFCKCSSSPEQWPASSILVSSRPLSSQNSRTRAVHRPNGGVCSTFHL